jgi:hypothetical protein
MRMLIGGLALLLGTGALAQSTPEDMAAIKARCAQYAREDQVPEKELASYMQDCINALRDQQNEDQGGSGGMPAGSRD